MSIPALILFIPVSSVFRPVKAFTLVQMMNIRIDDTICVTIRYACAQNQSQIASEDVVGGLLRIRLQAPL